MTTAGFDPNALSGGNVGLITSSTPSPMVGPIAVGQQRPTTTAAVQTKSQSDLIREYGQMSSDARKAISAKLKAAGYNVPVTGSYNNQVRTAYLDAHIALNDEIKLLQLNDPNRLAQVSYDLDLFLNDLASGKTTGTGSGRYQDYGQQTIYKPTKARAFLREQFKSLLNREPTAEELTTWAKKLKTEQEKAASASVTKYVMKNGVRTAVTTTGLDEAQWLSEQLAADKKLGEELTKVKTQAPGITELAANKKIYDDLVKAAKGDIGKINEAKQNTAYGRALSEYTAEVNDKIIKSGATNDPAKAADIAKYLLDRGLSLDSESAQSYIDAQLQFGKGKTTVGTKTVEGFTGEAGSNVDTLNKVALANGLTLDQVFDDAALSDVLSAVNAGEDINTYARIIRDAAKIAWNVPDNVAKLMDQGVSLDSIYGTYKRAYADTLELDPNTVTLKDLASMGVIGQPSKDSQAPQNLYDFKRALRKDNRWQYTQQANEEVAAATQKILQDFGFMG